MDIEQRKKQLREEILFAEANLVHNASEFNFASYILPRNFDLPALFSGLLNTSEKSIAAADLATTQFLAKDNFINKFFRYFKTLKKVYKIFIK